MRTLYVISTSDNVLISQNAYTVPSHLCSLSYMAPFVRFTSEIWFYAGLMSFRQGLLR